MFPSPPLTLLPLTIPLALQEFASCRGLKQSALYDRLAAKGAVFGQKFGWERPNYFTSDGGDTEMQYTYGMPEWMPMVAEEHRSAREGVALFDQSSFGKLLVQANSCGQWEFNVLSSYRFMAAGGCRAGTQKSCCRSCVVTILRFLSGRSCTRGC